jgi:hypothetical protein
MEEKIRNSDSDQRNMSLVISRERFAKGVTISTKSKDKQSNDQMKNYKRTNNDLQNITQKPNYWLNNTNTTLNGGES